MGYFSEIRREATESKPEALLFIAVLICIGVQTALVFIQAINWDEFRFLADVHLLYRGELSASVQTFHSHFFQWLPLLPSNEIDQIIAARLIMLILEIGISVMLYRCARKFTDVKASLLAVLCYLSFSYVMRHGASFRFDPMSTFPLMAAVTIMLSGRLTFLNVAWAGIFVAIAAMITIKSVFFVPTIVLLGLWRILSTDNRRHASLLMVAGALVGTLSLGFLYFYHQASLMVASSDAAEAIIVSSTSKTIGQSAFIPRSDFLVRSLLENPFHWILIVTGTAMAVSGIAKRNTNSRLKSMALLSFGLPLLTLLFYRNAFPYYYAFMLAPVCVLAAVGAQKLSKRVSSLFMGVILLSLGLLHSFQNLTPILATQRATIEAVHKIFPTPQAYIDRCSMIASSLKSGFFMSSWGTEVYRDAGQPVMADILKNERPVYVLMNSPILQAAMNGAEESQMLLAEDVAVLSENFIPHWGPIWVAGKRLQVSDKPVVENIIIPGLYTLEMRFPVSLDGTLYENGTVIHLKAGTHSFRSAETQKLTIRWGNRLLQPAEPMPEGPLFQHF